MMANLATPSSEGEPEGIEGILNHWCQQVMDQERVTEELTELDNIPNIDPDFRKAMSV